MTSYAIGRRKKSEYETISEALWSGKNSAKFRCELLRSIIGLQKMIAATVVFLFCEKLSEIKLVVVSKDVGRKSARLSKFNRQALCRCEKNLRKVVRN